MAFQIICLCLIFIGLLNMCLSVFLFRFILYGTLWASWTWDVKEVYDYNLLKYFLIPFLFLFFWDHYNLNVSEL